MKEFFKVTDLDEVLALTATFGKVGTETVPLLESGGRILAQEIVSDIDIPGFSRSTMDGYAVKASSTFGASEGNPAYLSVTGQISMGILPDLTIQAGEAARIATGGMLPQGADAVLMVEHTDGLDEATIEAYRSVAPGQNVIQKGEDVQAGQVILTPGTLLRPQETGLLSAAGRRSVRVYQRPRIGIISTGDEVVAVEKQPQLGEIRDINSYSLAGQVAAARCRPVTFGIVRDDYAELLDRCRQALEKIDMLLISGGSSVGMRDFTIEVLGALPDTEVMVHGISISPGKPTILARCGSKAVWGLPGHAVSAMVVFSAVVRPFIDRMRGLDQWSGGFQDRPAVLTRNIPSAQGRVDFVRVRLFKEGGGLKAEPVLGKSGLISTMVKADGLVRIDINSEGLDRGCEVNVLPI
jgi:molybdopterin molybdotransferase